MKSVSVNYSNYLNMLNQKGVFSQEMTKIEVDRLSAYLSAQSIGQSLPLSDRLFSHKYELDRYLNEGILRNLGFDTVLTRSVLNQ